MKFRILTLAVALCGALAQPAIAAERPDSALFAGKTITLYSGFGAEHAVSSWAHILAQGLGASLGELLGLPEEKQPTVIVKNMPGAGGINLLNYLCNVAHPDGTEVAIASPVMSQAIVGNPAIKCGEKGVQNVPLAGSAGDLNHVLLISRARSNAFSQSFLLKVFGQQSSESISVKSLADIVGRAPNRHLFVAQSAAGLGPWTTQAALLPFGITSTDLKGFSGSSIPLAMEQGNVQGSFVDTTTFQGMPAAAFDEKTGYLFSVCQRGIPDVTGGDEPARQPGIDVPTCNELIAKYRPEAIDTPPYNVLKLMVKMAAVGFAFALPPKTDPAIVALYNDALQKTFNNPSTQTLLEKGRFWNRFIDAATTRQMVLDTIKGVQQPENEKLLADIDRRIGLSFLPEGEKKDGKKE